MITSSANSSRVVLQSVQTLCNNLVQNIETVIIGKRPVIVNVLIALLCEGHVLLEDVPGVAKTVLAKSIAKSIGCNFQRIQCTPDLLPSDITGVSVFNQKTTEFEFRPGPAFAHILLADELNRATPRTQSALLECMAERQVTVETRTLHLERPFMVFATQNPIEHEGTFPLPEAQLDRFCMRLRIGYPSESAEFDLLESQRLAHPVESLQPVADIAHILMAQNAIRGVFVHEAIRDYIVKLVRATRGHPELAMGASPRATIALFRAAQAATAIRGFDYVLPDFVKQLAPFILEHRVMVKAEARLHQRTAAKIIWDIVEQLPAPVMKGSTCAT